MILVEVLASRNIKLGSWFVFLLVSCSTCDFQKPEMLGDQFFVHQLISEYFKAEQHLWTISESRSENTLQEIYSTNHYFLNKTLDIPMRKVYGYPFSSVLYLSRAELFNLKIEDPVKYPILKDKPDIFLSTNITNEILQDVQDFVDERTDLMFWKDLSNKTNQCYFKSKNLESSYQMLLFIYEETQLTLLKTYITAQISLLFQRYYLGEDLQFDEKIVNQATEVRNLFKERFSNIWKIVHPFLQTSNKDIRLCDRNITDWFSDYPQISNFLHRFVDNEVNLNEKSSCTQSCSDLKQTKHYGCSEGTLCEWCGGTVRECEDSNVEERSWTRWFVKCSNCLCICDNEAKDESSNRYFSLRDVVSGVDDNKIVTGIVITQKNGIIHLMIAQRKLLPFAMVSSAESELSSGIWQSTDKPFNVSDAEKNIDFHELTFEQRALNLDTVTAPKGCLVTGVRFHILHDHLSLQIRATEFNYATGQLKNVENSQWISNENGGKNEIYVQGSKKPTESPSEAMPYTTLNAYVKFGPGFYEQAQRSSQFTVPFFDPYAVEPYVPTALTGVGFYLTGKTGYAGFIGAKLVVYDFDENLTFNLN